MKQNKQGGFSEVWLSLVFIAIALIIFGIFHLVTLSDISRLEKHDTCFQELLTKNYDINYETDKINTFMSECMSLKD